MSLANHRRRLVNEAATRWNEGGVGKTALLSVIFFLCPLPQTASIPSAESKTLYDSGYQAAIAGDMKTAAMKFQAALAADPRNFLAQFDLGGIAEDAGDKEGALTAYEKTVSIAPDFAEAQVELGTVYLNERRDFDQAITHFRVALTTKAPFQDARFTATHTRSQAVQNLGVSYALKGRSGLAQGIARSYLADPALERQRDQAVQTLLQRASDELKKRTTRRFGEELQSISRQMQGGHLSEALAAYRRFEKDHDPTSLPAIDAWELYEGIGLALTMTNHLEEARVSFDKSRDAALPLPYPKLQESQFNLAGALARTGHADEAIAVLDDVLWEDFITALDTERAKKEGYASSVMTDKTLASIRDNPKLRDVLNKYAR
jgi:tetratricopeptide (TPR) repeat protein